MNPTIREEDEENEMYDEGPTIVQLEPGHRHEAGSPMHETAEYAASDAGTGRGDYDSSEKGSDSHAKDEEDEWDYIEEGAIHPSDSASKRYYGTAPRTKDTSDSQEPASPVQVPESPSDKPPAYNVRIVVPTQVQPSLREISASRLRRAHTLPDLPRNSRSVERKTKRERIQIESYVQGGTKDDDEDDDDDKGEEEDDSDDGDEEEEDSDEHDDDWLQKDEWLRMRLALERLEKEKDSAKKELEEFRRQEISMKVELEVQKELKKARDRWIKSQLGKKMMEWQVEKDRRAKDQRQREEKFQNRADNDGDEWYMHQESPIQPKTNNGNWWDRLGEERMVTVPNNFDSKASWTHQAKLAREEFQDRPIPSSTTYRPPRSPLPSPGPRAHAERQLRHGPANYPRPESHHHKKKQEPYKPRPRTRYAIPLTWDGKQLSIDVQISGRTVEQRHGNKRHFGPWNWPVASTDDGPMEGGKHLIHISEAKRWLGSEQKHQLDLKCVSGTEDPAENASRSTRWLHVQSDNMDFGIFSDIALGIPDLPSDYKIVVIALLDRIRTSFLKEGARQAWVLRADSSESGTSNRNNNCATPTATAMSFPFLTLGPFHQQATDRPHQHNSRRSLFEWDSAFIDSPQEANSKQAYRRLGDAKDAKDNILTVPLVWALLVNDTLVTYGPVPFDTIRADSIHLHQEKPVSHAGPTTVHVTDTLGREFLFMLKDYPSLFELVEAIRLRVQVAGASRLPQHLRRPILYHEDTPVTAENWIPIVKSESSDTIHLTWKPESLTAPGLEGRLEEPELQIMHAGDDISAKWEQNEKPLKPEVPTEGFSSHTVDMDEGYTTDSSAASEVDTGIPVIATSNERPKRVLKALPPPTVPEDSDKMITLYKGGSRELALRQALSTPTALVLGNVHPSDFRMRDILRERPRTHHHDPSEKIQSEQSEMRLVKYHDMTREKTPRVYKLPDTTKKKESQSAKPEDRSIQPQEPRSPGPDSKKRHRTTVPQVQLKIPPFLSWATDKGGIELGISEETYSRILQALHQNLYDGVTVTGGKLYRRAREAPREEIDDKISTVSRSLEPQTPPELSNSPVYQWLNKSILSPPNRLQETDRLHGILVEECSSSIDGIFRNCQELLGFYLPLSSTASQEMLLRKMWGTFLTLSSATEQGLKKDLTEYSASIPTFWVIRDWEIFPSTRKEPSGVLPWRRCRDCANGKVYTSFQQGVLHLRATHFDIPEIFFTDDFRSYVRSDHHYRTDQRLDLYLQYLRSASSVFDDVVSKAKYIRAGVASGQYAKSSKYQLPEALVRALEYSTMILIHLGDAIHKINRYCGRFEDHLQSDEMKYEDQRRLQTALIDLERMGAAASMFMRKAEQDILLMAHTNLATNTASYDAVGPEYILGTILTNLANKPIHGKLPIQDLYTSFYRKIEREATKHPRTRLIGEIRDICKELSLVREINAAQICVLKDFSTSLAPFTFRTTTMVRESRYQTEQPLLASEIQRRTDVEKRFLNIDTRLQEVKEHVATMLRIQQENQGKAIIVFTIVTIVFLPLSWATSYLGMNTVDIRDLRQGQWLYWSVAMPVTAAVIGLTVLVVLKGEDIREFFIDRERLHHQRRLEKVAAIRRQSTMFSTHTKKPKKEKYSSVFRRGKSRSSTVGDV